MIRSYASLVLRPISMKEQTKLPIIVTMIDGTSKSDKAHFVPRRYKPINTTAKMLKKYIR